MRPHGIYCHYSPDSRFISREMYRHFVIPISTSACVRAHARAILFFERGSKNKSVVLDENYFIRLAHVKPLWWKHNVQSEPSVHIGRHYVSTLDGCFVVFAFQDVVLCMRPSRRRVLGLICSKQTNSFQFAVLEC